MNEQFTVTFQTLPKNLSEMQQLPQAALTQPQDAAALFLAAMCRFSEDRDAAYEMIDYLRGPRPLSAYEKQFLRDRMTDTDAVPRSYFSGAVRAVRIPPAALCCANRGVRENIFSGNSIFWSGSVRQMTLGHNQKTVK